MPYDIHCHFFNKEILSLRLLVDLLWVLIRRKGEIATNPEAKAHLGRIIRFLHIGLSDVPHIYKTLESDERKFTFCPLMFDLEACTWTKAVESSGWQTELQEALDQWKQTIETPEEHEIGDLIDKYITNGKVLFLPEQSESRFQAQVNQLEQLALTYPDQVRPFFAVDPRRSEFFGTPSAIDNVLAKLKREGGLFQGIKMYSPNGYSPTDERLWPLYEYCQRYHIPITAHCSGSGFATFAKSIDVNGFVYLDGKIVKHTGTLTFKHNGLFNSKRVEERAECLNHPKLWAIVLERFPRLTLNLAHFGLHDGEGEWTNLIYGMMLRHENLYTDFSCVCEAPALDHFYEQYYTQASPSVKARFLYGSDFYLNILFSASMTTYFDQFKARFTDDEWLSISERNPQKFLGLDRPSHLVP